MTQAPRNPLKPVGIDNMDANQVPRLVTVRDGGIRGEADFCHHLECRFPDGQKHAAVEVDADYEELAHLIAAFLNDPELVAKAAERMAS